MILSSLHQFGSTPLRSVAVGFAQRPHVVDGFRPVVAGQYLRLLRTVDPTQFTFLEPLNAAAPEYRLSVNVSPRMIWQVMSPPGERTLTVVSRADGLLPDFHTHTDRHTYDSRTTNTKPTDTTFNSPEANTPASNESPRDTSGAVHTADTSRAGSSHNEVRFGQNPAVPKSADRFSSLSEVIHWMMSTSATPVSYQAGTYQGPGATTQVTVFDGFRPVTLTFHNHDSSVANNDARSSSPFEQSGPYANQSASRIDHSASHFNLPAWQPSVSGEWMSRGSADSTNHASFASVVVFRDSLAREFFIQGGPLTRVFGNSSPEKMTFLVTPLARRVAEHLITQSLSQTRQNIEPQASTRTSVFSTIAFGGIAAAGMDRPADLVPLIFQTNAAAESGDVTGQVARGATGSDVLAGISRAGVFADVVTAAYRRADGSDAEPGIGKLNVAGQVASPRSPMMEVQTVVRSKPANAAPSARTPSDVHNPQQTAAWPNYPDRAPALPANLIQQLTEQVVQSLDSRAHAARERMGRF